MPKKQRNYKAEYARRVALAQDRGFRNYADQRRKIETGRAQAIAPARIRTKRTLDAQQSWQALPWERKVNQKEIRIQMAQEWSRVYSRTKVIRFDAQLARRDDEYLQSYMRTFVLGDHEDQNINHFSDSFDLKHYLVDVMEYMTEDEYERRYGGTSAE